MRVKIKLPAFQVFRVQDSDRFTGASGFTLCAARSAPALSPCSGVPMEGHLPCQPSMTSETSSCQGAGGGGTSPSPGAGAQCALTEKGQRVAGTKPFLDRLQGQAGSHNGRPVGAHLPEPNPSTNKGKRLRAAQRYEASSPPGWEQGWRGPAGGAQPQAQLRAGGYGAGAGERGSVLPSFPGPLQSS